MLLRVLFPSWKFFDEIEFIHELMVRVRTTESAMGEWQPAPSFPDRTPLSLFLNAGGNIRHAENSLIESLVQRLRKGERQNIESWPVFEMVRLLACQRAQAIDSEATHFQFALILKRIGEEEISLEESLVSPEYKVTHG